MIPNTVEVAAWLVLIGLVLWPVIRRTSLTPIGWWIGAVAAAVLTITYASSDRLAMAAMWAITYASSDRLAMAAMWAISSMLWAYSAGRCSVRNRDLRNRLFSKETPS